MIHYDWIASPTQKKIKCIHTDAEKFTVNHTLTPGQIYNVKNETKDFYFIIDNTKRIGGFLKDYFEELK